MKGDVETQVNGELFTGNALELKEGWRQVEREYERRKDVMYRRV